MLTTSRRPTVLPAPPTPAKLGATASEAIARFCATLDDSAREVETRSDSRTARQAVNLHRSDAIRALDACYCALAETSPEAFALRVELSEIADGVRVGYVRAPWALRVVQIMAEAVKP